MTDVVHIRPAAMTEQEALEGLQWRASLMWEEDRDALLAHPDAIELPVEQLREKRALVAEINDQVVGFAVVLPRMDGNAELDGLFVEPANWRNGIGTRLVAAAAELAIFGGSRFLYVIGNPRAADFYRACGFDLIGQQATRFGVGFVMRKLCAQAKA